MEDLNAYSEEFIKPLLVSLGYYRNCNIVFFDTRSSFWARYWRFIIIIPFCILYYICFWTYIVKMFTEGISPFEEANLIPMWLVAHQEFFKFVIMMKNRKQVRALIEHLGTVWRTTDLSEEQLKTKNSALKLFNKSAKILAWQYILLPFAETLIRTFFLGQKTKFKLLFACVPFAVDDWPTYLTVYAFQGCAEFFMVCMYLGSYILLVDLSTYISIQFTLLQEDVMNIRPTNTRKSTTFGSDDAITENGERNGCNFKEFVKRHQDIILLTQELNAIYNKVIFASLLFSTLVICFFAIAAKVSTGTAYTVTNYFAIIHIMLTMYVMCYCSEMLSASSTGIAESAVKNLWYEGDLRYRRTMCFIIMRSQEPCTLRSLYFPIICASIEITTMEGIYPEEFINSVLKSLSYFKKCNIDVFDSKNSLYRKFWWLFNIPSFILNYITLTMYIVKIFTEGVDPFEKIYMIPVWLVTTQEFFVCIIIIQKEKEIRTVIEHLGSIWRTKDLTEYQSNNKKTKMKQLNFGQKSMKFILDQEAELMLPYASVYPFAVDSWATYLGVLAFQIYNMLFVIFMYLGSNLLLVSLSTGLSIQFNLLQADLINIKPTNNSEEIVFGSNEEIVKWSACNIEEFVKFHQDVILLAQQLSAVFDKIVFLSLLFATIIVCFFAVACKASLGFGYMLINFGAIFTVMMTVLIMCYCSEQLSASSTGIAESAVKNLWYKGDLRYQTIILFIIMRSQNPCTLRTLNYFSISINTFNKVLKTTYSYFSLASQLYDARD
ncbi:hypothetical protein ABMA28_004163 [Loxostege sticticalis]|uniref:Odorant receptor n=1 Tax=Loxostege sticticalis TaxID=481309 RepID=A0ABD0SUH7_LOXSC